MKKTIQALIFVCLYVTGNAKPLVINDGLKCEYEIPVEVDLFKGQIKVSNTEGFPFRIDEIKASCGCTIPKFGTEIVQSGLSTTIDFEYAVKKKNGKDLVVLNLISTVFRNNTQEKQDQKIELFFTSENSAVITPRILTWAAEDKSGVNKSISVKSEKEFNLNLSTENISDKFTISVKKDSSFEYTISIILKQTDSLATSLAKHLVLPVTISLSDGREYKDYIHFLLTK